MKKFLLLAISAFAAVAAMAADAPAWTASVNGIFEDSKPIYSGVVTVDASGNTFAAGAYNQDATVGSTQMSAIGTSAYIIKYNATGTAVWAVSLEGAASVSAMTTDADGNLYVAGTFADVVTLGSTDGVTAEIEGMKVDGEFVEDRNASFIAKYTSVGVLAAHTIFVPDFLPNCPGDRNNVTLDSPYDWNVNNIVFNISTLYAAGNKLYAAATYTGITKNGTASFESSIVDAYGWGTYMDITAASAFSLSTNLTDCTECAKAEGSANSDEYIFWQVNGIALTAKDDVIYAAVTGNGPLTFTSKSETKTADAGYYDFSYSFMSIKDAAISQFKSIKVENADYGGVSVAAMSIDGANTVECFGAQDSDIDNAKIKHVFVASFPSTDVNAVTIKLANTAVGDCYYNDITGAVLCNGTWIYASAERKISGGNKTNAYKAFEIKDSALTAAPAADAFTLGSNGKVVTYATITGEGAAYAQYAAPQSGIDGIVADDENALVEYYNLQGIRVENPENGLYIRRQGSSVSKVIIK